MTFGSTRSTSMGIALLGALVFVMAMLPAAAAAQESQGAFRGETTVNVVEVPVRVIDPETGNQVTGLKAADFRITEGGAVQNISNFSEITRPGSAQWYVDSAELEALGETGTVPEMAEVKPVETIYFVDLFLALKGDKMRAIHALREQYRSQVPEDEEVSLVVFDGALEVLLDRSDDNFDVLDALDELEGMEAHGIQQFVSFTDSLTSGNEASGERDQAYYERRQRNREYFVEMEKRVTRVGNAISAAMARYAIADARRVIVAFTPGFPLSNWQPTYTPIELVNNDARYPAQDLWHNLALEAADLGYTMYVVDSSGLRTSTAGDAEIGVTSEIGALVEAGELFGERQGQERRVDPVETGDDFARNDPNAKDSDLGGWMERTRKNLLIAAAATTGGEAVFDHKVDRAMVGVAKSLYHYYSLAYTAEHSGDGKVYDIKVELPNHPDYRVVHRTAYVDQPNSTRQAQRLRSAMLFGGDANPLGIRVELGDVDEKFRLGAANSKRVKVPFVIKIPYARVDMIPRGDRHWGKLLITFFSEDEMGNQSQLASLEQEISVASQDYDQAVAKGYFSYSTTVEIEGGQQKVYVGIQDSLSGRTSIMPQTFDF